MQQTLRDYRNKEEEKIQNVPMTQFKSTCISYAFIRFSFQPQYRMQEVSFFANIFCTHL